MRTRSGRRYYPLTLIAKPLTCFMCAANAKSEVDLQRHMNACHPGWLDTTVRKILGPALSHPEPMRK
jgi:hypothetical protein